MLQERTEMEKRKILRLSNEESNRLSRECMQTALIYLMAKKDLDEISISELVRKAGVSRTAFYNNYSSKDEILLDLSKKLLNDMNELVAELFLSEDRCAVFQRIFQRVKEDSRLYTLLLKSGLHDREFLNVRKIIQEEYPDIDDKTKYLVYAWGGMMKSIILGWVYEGMKEPEKQMAQLCCELSEPIMNQMKYFG